MTYKVSLPIFEGPLDLLLYLIKKEELDIYDIPISKITSQYLEYIELMKLLDLNIAGEFLVMAATLMHIKSKMLLPPEENPEEDTVEEDPRAELVRRLIEYKKFKEAAGALSELEKRQKDVFPRRLDVETLEAMGGDDGFEANIFDLITAFVKVVKDFSKDDFHRVVKDEFTVSQKIHDLYHMLVETPVICFTELFRKAKNRLEAITIFLALLELIRLNEVKVLQKNDFGEIEIVRNPDAVKPDNAPQTAAQSPEEKAAEPLGDDSQANRGQQETPAIARETNGVDTPAAQTEAGSDIVPDTGSEITDGR
ncbi:MAG: segregation/condensation protein A [Candidatus Omnitrophica bacterium]|nr:segregation/condensation protein A [Candidatus Omnitrophota bacterium]